MHSIDAQDFLSTNLLSLAQNHFTVRKSVQYFLEEEDSKEIDASISILINSLDISFGAILKNINPVIYKVKRVRLLFPVKHRKPQVPQGFSDWFSTSFSISCSDDLYEDS